VGPRAARALIATALVALALTAQASATPPTGGVLVPGERLGGIRVGMTKSSVERVWGPRFGRCRGCRHETWYFNYKPFAPQGAGISFRDGRVAAVFTLWQPEGWHTTRGLTLGANESQITRLYPAALREACSGYSALVLLGKRAASVFYVRNGELWGFGLMRLDWAACQ